MGSRRADRDGRSRSRDALSESLVVRRSDLHGARACYAVSPLMPLVVCTAYLIGSIPFALLLARRWGAIDLRRVGSGNLGAANVMRATGITAGILVAIPDITNGAARGTLAPRLSGNA